MSKPSIGGSILMTIKTLGISERELSDKAGLSRTAVRDLLHGVKPSSLSPLTVLNDLLGALRILVFEAKKDAVMTWAHSDLLEEWLDLAQASSVDAIGELSAERSSWRQMVAKEIFNGPTKESIH